jgi:hypothetical protein
MREPGADTRVDATVELPPYRTTQPVRSAPPTKVYDGPRVSLVELS